MNLVCESTTLRLKLVTWVTWDAIGMWPEYEMRWKSLKACWSTLAKYWTNGVNAKSNGCIWKAFLVLLISNANYPMKARHFSQLISNLKILWREHMIGNEPRKPPLTNPFYRENISLFSEKKIGQNFKKQIWIFLGATFGV